MTDKATSDLWWKNAVIYCADVATWLDSDGDGIGDLAGLTRRLDYLWGLGINTLWMMPFYPSPLGDDGYDITDYYAVDSRFGTLGDFVEMIRTADNLGIRVLVDLVMSHTSNQHPWFQRSRHDRDSRYRDYYRWSDTKQGEPREVAFPGEQTSTWTYDDVAGQWYMHRYYDFMPDLNITDPDVLDEMHKVLGLWLELGISGFRVDSLPFMIETIGTNAKDQPVTYLRSLVEFLERRRGDAIFLGEANVSPRGTAALLRCRRRRRCADAVRLPHLRRPVARARPWQRRTADRRAAQPPPPSSAGPVRQLLPAPRRAEPRVAQ